MTDTDLVSAPSRVSGQAGQPREARDPRQIRTDRALQEALLSLLVEKPFDQITITEICAQADVHKATFFRRYALKGDLLNYVATSQINQWIEHSVSVGDGIEGFVTLCEYVSRQRAIWTALLNGGAGGVMREEMLRVAQRLADEQTEFEGWLPLDLAVISSVTLIVETISWWLAQPEDRYSPHEVADIIFNLVGCTRSHQKAFGG